VHHDHRHDKPDVDADYDTIVIKHDYEHGNNVDDVSQHIQHHIDVNVDINHVVNILPGRWHVQLWHPHREQARQVWP